MKNKIIVSLIFMFFLAACQPSAELKIAEEVNSESVAQVTVTMTPSVTAVPTSTSTPITPTATVLLPTETATSTTTPTIEPTATATMIAPSPTAVSTEATSLDNPFSVDHLVTADQLALFSEDIGIFEWKLAEEVAWDFRVCRIFSGASWSISENIAINCIFKTTPNVTMEEMIQWFVDNEILLARAIPLEPSIIYENEFVLYGDQYDNGQSAFDLFLMGDGVVYWASVSVGTPVGYTAEEVFNEFGTTIEAFLNEMVLINLGKSERISASGEGESLTHLDLAKEHFSSGEFTKANDLLLEAGKAFPEVMLRTFEEQLSSNPDDAFAFYGRGIANTFLNNIEDAISDYSHSIDLAAEDPMSQYAYLMRGVTHYYFEDDLGKALADWEKTLEIEPANADAHSLIAMAYAEAGDYETAVEKLLTAVAQDIPSDDKIELARLLISHSENLIWQSENEEQAALAVAAFVLVDSDIPEVQIIARRYNNICWYASLWGMVKEVLFACEQAVEMEPEHGGYRDSRGLARALTGNFEGAIEDFRFFIDWGLENGRSQEAINLREEWIEALANGINPFNEETLEMLRNE